MRFKGLITIINLYCNLKCDYMKQSKCRCTTVFLCALIVEMTLLSCNKTDPNRAPLRSNAPILDSILPKSRPVGTTVTLYGKNLGDNTSQISANGRKAENKTPSQTRFVITIPDSAGTGPITINGRTSGVIFNYVFTDIWKVTTFAGNGDQSIFNNSKGIAIHASGNLYVADAGNHRIRMITTNGTVSTFAGSGTAGVTNAMGTAAQFNNPLAITIDQQSNLYIADAGNNKIRMINTNRVVSDYPSSSTTVQFNGPAGIVIDRLKNIYAGDASNHRIRFISTAGVITTFAGSGVPGIGTNPATGTAAQFNHPAGLVMDLQQTNLYVADSGNNRIRKITTPGAVVTAPIKSGNPTPFTDAAGVQATLTDQLELLLILLVTSM